MLDRLRRSSHQASDDSRGTALIEFAFSLPFMLLLFVGGYQISDGVFAYRKATQTTRALADLTSQFTDVSDTDLANILDASSQVLSPYQSSNAEVRVSQIRIDCSGQATVDWSKGKNTGGYLPGASFYVPAAYRQANSVVIVAEIVYHYKPAFASSLIGNIDLKEQVTMYPRKSSSINKV